MQSQKGKETEKEKLKSTKANRNTAEKRGKEKNAKGDEQKKSKSRKCNPSKSVVVILTIYSYALSIIRLLRYMYVLFYYVLLHLRPVDMCRPCPKSRTPFPENDCLQSFLFSKLQLQ